MGYLVPLNFSLEVPHVNRRNVHGQWLKQKLRMQRDLNSKLPHVLRVKLREMCSRFLDTIDLFSLAY